MSESHSASSSSNALPPRAAWPIAPWRVAVLLLCFTLAAWAARLAWVEAHADRAQAADPELMLLVAQRWAAAQRWDPAAADLTTQQQELQRDTQRVLALLAEQQTLEPERSAALVPQRDRWARAQQALAQAASGPGAATDAALASRELMQALRHRAEQRQQPDAGAARPGVMLAVASLGLLLVGWRLPRRNVQLRPLDSRLEEVPPSVLPSFLPSFLPSVLPALAEPEQPSLLLSLQLEIPAGALAELPAPATDARRELERQVTQRLRTVLPGAGIARSEPTDDALWLDLRVADPGALDARRALVQRLFEEMADAYTVYDHPLALPASLGVVEPEFTGSSDALRDAHATRDLARGQGGGIVFYSPELGRRLAAARTMRDALEAAITSGALHLEFQPVVALAGDRAGLVIGLRAQAVWQHPQLGRREQADFMPAAEDHGCADRVADFVWRSALAQLADWRSRRGERCPPWVVVPGWACSWRRDDLVSGVQQLLAELQLPASALQVSLAEPLLATDDSLPARVQALRALGVAVVLEGLGHASASLSWLSRLPVSAVAIDHGFVATLPGHEAHQMLVKAIVSLADAQGISTCADGVERDEQRQALAALGVQSAQGPHLGPALAGPAFEAWLQSRPH